MPENIAEALQGAAESTQILTLQVVSRRDGEYMNVVMDVRSESWLGQKFTFSAVSRKRDRALAYALRQYADALERK